MSFLDVFSMLIGIVFGCSAAKRYAEDLFPDDFFYKPKHKKKSNIRKWLERAAFFILGGD